MTSLKNFRRSATSRTMRAAISPRQPSIATLAKKRRASAMDIAAISGNPIYAAPLFDTGDERYTWLNRIQAVSKGMVDGLTLTYEIYELR